MRIFKRGSSSSSQEDGRGKTESRRKVEKQKMAKAPKDSSSPPPVKRSKHSSPSGSRREDKDSQKELQKKAGTIELARTRTQGPGDNTSPKQTNLGSMTETKFLETIDAIQVALIQVRKTTITIRELQEEVLFEASPKTRNVDSLVQITNTLALEIKSSLMRLEKAAAEEEGGGARARMRQNMFLLVARQFKEDIEKYQAAHESYKAELRRKTERQMRIVQPDVTDEEISSILHEEDGLQTWYRQHILADHAVQKQLVRANETYQDIQRLERSVAELHGMFLDLAFLTEEQGQLLDQIEFHVQQAGDKVEDANANTYEATEYQRKIRKKQCWIIVIVVVIATVVVLLLL